MVSIERKPQVIASLHDTSKRFKKDISGMTVDDAYDYFKRNKTVYMYNTVDTKTAFSRMTHKRCSLCTQPILDYNSAMTVEHIENKEYAPQKIFEWSNLLCSCKTCNTGRGRNKYEPALYLDPTTHTDIERYFDYTIIGEICPKKGLSLDDTNSANYMIEMYKLNRPDLIRARKRFFLKLFDDYKTYEKMYDKDPEDPGVEFVDLLTYYNEKVK